MMKKNIKQRTFCGTICLLKYLYVKKKSTRPRMVIGDLLSRLGDNASMARPGCLSVIPRAENSDNVECIERLTYDRVLHGSRERLIALQAHTKQKLAVIFRKL